MTAAAGSQPGGVSAFDARPFFEKALAFGAQKGMFSDTVLQALRIDGAKGMVQIADFFGTSFLRANLEEARQRIITLASLYLEDYSGGDLMKAACSLRDNSFLSHSRGGSEMLKKLHALPKSTLFGDVDTEPVADFLAQWSLYGLGITPAYRAALAERQSVANSLSAAAWFAERMDIPRAALGVNALDERYLASAEGVIRTAILLRLAKDQSCPNRADFARLVLNLRSKGIPARARKLLQGDAEAVPENYRALEQTIRRNIEQYDLPKIADPTVPLDVLLSQLEERYFLRPTGINEVSEYDAMVSAEWHKVMKGRTEPDARLTAFLCLAGGAPPKPAMSEAVARTLVRKLRTHGIDSAAVLKFIEKNAPYDLRESLASLWEEEFLPDAEIALLDASDEKLIRAMAFLRENCQISAAPAARKKAAG